MRQCLVSVFDSAVAGYGRPMCVVTTGVAERSFTDEVNRQAEDNDLFKHPEHFSLWLVGHFEDDSGSLVPVKPAVLLCEAASVKRPR